MHDLYAIALVQDVFVMAAARHDFPIDFHCNPPIAMPGFRKQRGKRRSGFALVRLAVEIDLHGRNCNAPRWQSRGVADRFRQRTGLPLLSGGCFLGGGSRCAGARLLRGCGA